MKVLVADDELPIRMLMEQTLEDIEGIELFFASNGEEALHAISEENPEIVFLDVMMPEYDGYEVLEIVHSHKEYDNMRVILLTAKGSETDIRRAEMYNIDLYITKPFDPDFILDKTTKIIEEIKRYNQ
ncbi:response regulator [Clostridium sp. 'White wine YQ']|uniref:response regulator n=1 Tax=Clostridium sp. 'White wine YQ' TaxID=3027474 RepID=UPI002366EFBF|nr:response regulator [Clostridium sp. 'White wine YQ']MDD7795818.1 response regulator [Clostridium sp. 'White wine YQ']